MSEKNPKSFDLALLWRVIKLGTPYKRLFVATGVLAIVMSAMGIMRPYLVQIMVDDFIVPRDMEGLFAFAWIFVIVVIITVILRYMFIYSTALVGQSIIKDLRVTVFNKLVSLRLRYFDQTPIGNSTTRTVNDVEAINNIFTQGLITMLADILGIFIALAMMFYTSWKLTLVCLTTLPFLILATYIFKEKVKTSYEQVRTKISKMNAFLQERISGMSLVQIFAAEEQELEKFKKINRDQTQGWLDSIFYYAVFFPVVELINFVTLALVVWLGSYWFLDGNVTMGALIAFPVYINMLFRPVRMLADKFNTLQMGLVAADRVFKVIDNKELIPDTGQITSLPTNADIAFENVEFAYDGKNKIIKDLSFKLKSGATLAIVGSTGSGKTTIINILNRFYDIQGGKIKIGNVNIQDYKLVSLRQSMAMVLQDVFLFNGSVLDNITLRNREITREDVIKSAKLIGAHPFIDQLPNGYDYIVTERGGNLSMGQRQLISFVRALVVEPEILILDEATSSIDTETEMVIQYAIEKLIEKRTSIIIAHRLTTIRHADHILVMDQGQLKEFGTHEELLAIQNGHYRELYEMQFQTMEHSA